MRAGYHIPLSIWLLLGAPVAAETRVTAVHQPERSYDSNSYIRCMNKSSAVTANMMDCMGHEQRRADHLLELAYDRSLAKRSREQRRWLQDSQRKWSKSLPHICENEPEQREFEGGTAAALSYAACFLDETKHRTEWLARHHR